MRFIKEIKNAPSALLSYISTREFLRTRERCGEARAQGECFSHFFATLEISSLPRASVTDRLTKNHEQIVNSNVVQANSNYEWFNFPPQSFSFNTERLPQYKRDSDKKSKFLFLHYSNTKGFWDWWIIILTMYIAIMVPYNVACRRDDREGDLLIFDMVIELFFIIDIVVHFRTSFVDTSGRIIYDQKKIAVRYLKGWFILDFLAALPFEALYFMNQSWVSVQI